MTKKEFYLIENVLLMTQVVEENDLEKTKKQVEIINNFLKENPEAEVKTDLFATPRRAELFNNEAFKYVVENLSIYKTTPVLGEALIIMMNIIRANAAAPEESVFTTEDVINMLEERKDIIFNLPAETVQGIFGFFGLENRNDLRALKSFLFSKPKKPKIP